MLTEDERSWISKLIHDAVRESFATERQLVIMAIDQHAHGDDHVAFRAFIADLERKQLRWDKITTSVVGAMIIGVLYWVGSHTIEIAAWIVRSAK
jgi:hypothetical protein